MFPEAAPQTTARQVRTDDKQHTYSSNKRLEKWNRILGIICLLISILTSIKLYYRTDAGQMLFFQYCVVLKPLGAFQLTFFNKKNS